MFCINMFLQASSCFVLFITKFTVRFGAQVQYILVSFVNKALSSRTFSFKGIFQNVLVKPNGGLDSRDRFRALELDYFGRSVTVHRDATNASTRDDLTKVEEVSAVDKEVKIVKGEPGVRAFNEDIETAD